MKNKLLDSIMKLITIFYFCFSGYWTAITVKNNILRSFVYFGIIILILYLISNTFRKKNNIKVNKKLIIIIFSVIALGLRLMLLYLDYNKPLSDYATFYYNAIYVATGEGMLSARYISAFPYLYSYIFLLGNFMKLFGASYDSVILLNILLDLTGGLLIYLFSKNINKKIGVYAYILWLFNPFNIYFSTICSPVIAVNTFIALVLYISTLFIKNINTKKTYIYALLLGGCLTLANIFRPIMIIFIIALFIYLMYFAMKENKKVKLIISFLVVFTVYQIGNYGYFNFVSSVSGYDVHKSMSGWSIYVGSNYEASGEWSTSNIDIYNKYYNDSEYTPDKFNDVMMRLGIDRYKNNGFKKNIILLSKKSSVLASKVNDYNYSSFIFIDKSDYKYLEFFVQKFTDIFWYLLIILNFIFAFIFIKFNSKNYKFIFLYCLYVLGFCTASLIVEVSPRYFYPIFPIMILTSSISLNEIIKFWKEKFVV